MATFGNKTVLCFDNGVFPEFARRLADDFGRVLYWSPWAGVHPVSKSLLIGRGDDKVERIVDPWTLIERDEVDLYFFGDVYEGALQSYLRSRGKRVFGCGRGAELEMDRVKAKKIMAKSGIPVGPYKEIVGIKALRTFLKANDNQFVKQDATRGDFETFHASSYAQIEPRLDELEHSLGAQAEIKEFIVEQGIDDAIEVGYDGYAIDGQFPKVGMVGIEIKNKSYVGKIMPYKRMSEQVRSVNASLSDAMRAYQYRGFFSNEVRITKDGKGYPIDLTARLPSPPSELYEVIFKNLADIVWYGAEGELVEPEYEDVWGAEVLMISEWANQNWLHVDFPPKIRDSVKLRNFCVINGEHYVVSQLGGGREVGSVVATGKTAKEAMDKVKAVAKEVKGYELEMPVDTLDEALESLNKLLADTKPASKEQAAAEDAVKAGKISQRQYERLAERHSWA
jgi:phosphoribosylamine-glycine ligase